MDKAHEIAVDMIKKKLVAKQRRIDAVEIEANKNRGKADYKISMTTLSNLAAIHGKEILTADGEGFWNDWKRDNPEFRDKHYKRSTSGKATSKYIDGVWYHLCPDDGYWYPEGSGKRTYRHKHFRPLYPKRRGKAS